MFGFVSGKKNAATIQNNGHAGGLSERAIDILKGGKGKAYLAKKLREFCAQLATKKQQIMQSISDPVSLMAVAPLQSIVAVAMSLVAKMEDNGRNTGRILSDVIGRKCRALAAQFREFCMSKNIFRPVAKAEPLVNVVALFVAFACLETGANTSIYFRNGLFPTIEMTVLFSATVALINVGLAWCFGYLTLRRWHHSSERVRAWSRRSVLPLVCMWLALHTACVLLRLSEDVNFQEFHLQDVTLMTGVASLMLVLIAVLSTAICAYKAYTCCGDVDSEAHDNNERWIEEPRESAESHAYTGQDQLDAWRDEAQEKVNQGWAMLDAIEAKLNGGKAGAEQGRTDLAAFAADLQKQFDVEIAETSTHHTYDWTQAGPTHARLAFTTEELSIPWDDEGEIQVRAFLQHWRDELTKLQTELDRAYTEASAQITNGLADIYKHQHFLPEGS